MVCNSTPPLSLPIPFPLSYLMITGKVTTLCTILSPNCVAITANRTILVSTIPNLIYKATPQGIVPSTHLLPSPLVLANNMHQNHNKSIKLNILRDLEEVEEWMGDQENAVFNFLMG